MDKGKDFVESFKRREDAAFEKFVALEKCKVRRRRARDTAEAGPREASAAPRAGARRAVAAADRAAIADPNERRTCASR